MNTTRTAQATVTINAPASRVWEALMDPELIKQYLFGAEIVSDWKEAARSSTKASMKGKPMKTRAASSKLNLKNYYSSPIGRRSPVRQTALKTIIRSVTNSRLKTAVPSLRLPRTITHPGKNRSRTQISGKWYSMA